MQRMDKQQKELQEKFESLVRETVAIFHKQYLKPCEAAIYTGNGRTQLAKKCSQFGIYKTATGYYIKEDLDEMMSGGPSRLKRKALKLKV
jgi:hypothetical protein